MRSSSCQCGFEQCILLCHSHVVPRQPTRPTPNQPCIGRANDLKLFAEIRMSFAGAAAHMALPAGPTTARSAARAPGSASAARNMVPAAQAARCSRTAAPSGAAAAAAATARRRNVAAAGEGRSANRTKWASGELSGAGSSAGTAVLEPPPPAGDVPAAAAEQKDASELVRLPATGNGACLLGCSTVANVEATAVGTWHKERSCM